MAIGASAESDPFPDMLLRGAEAVATNNGDSRFAIRFWESKKSEQVPQAKNPSLQEELNKTHVVYQQRIKDCVANLKELLSVGEEWKSFYEREFDPFTFIDAHEDLQKRYDAFFSKYQEHQVELKTLEDRIIGMIKTP